MGEVIPFPGVRLSDSVTEPDSPLPVGENAPAVEHSEEYLEQFDEWRDDQYEHLLGVVLQMEDAGPIEFFKVVEDVRAIFDVWGSG